MACFVLGIHLAPFISQMTNLTNGKTEKRFTYIGRSFLVCFFISNQRAKQTVSICYTFMSGLLKM